MARRVPLVVLSDCHLGTPGCRARELLAYLHEVDPAVLVLNGDLCDLGPYWRNHWPASHRAVLHRLYELVTGGTRVAYVIGNHDAAIGSYPNPLLDRIEVVRRLELAIHDRRVLVVHGDCLDGELGAGGVAHRLGSVGYELLMRVSCGVDRLRGWLGREPAALATAVKHLVPGAAGYVERFESAAAGLAAREGFDAVVCGHIHQPRMRAIAVDGRAVAYCNSGDWVEHCTALELVDGEWRLHRQLAPHPRPLRLTVAETAGSIGRLVIPA